MKKWTFLFIQLSITQAISWFVILSPLKGRIQSYLFPKQDELLAVAVGDLDGLGNKIKVLKFKSSKGIRIEFLKESDDGIRELVNRVETNHPYNGYFMYRGHTVQLGMADIDGDGIMEVIAPSFDKNLVAHLNVYRYDSNKRLPKSVFSKMKHNK